MDSRLPAWVAYTGREDLKTKTASMLSRNYKVCSDHFTDRDFMNPACHNRLTRQAIPSVPHDAKVAVSGQKKAHSWPSSAANERLSTCQRTTKRRWKWQNEAWRFCPSPVDDNNQATPDDESDDGAAMAPLPATTSDEQFFNHEDVSLYLEVGDSGGESIPEQSVPSPASPKSLPLPKVVDPDGECVPEESVPSPASPKVLPLPKIVECYSLQQSSEWDRYVYINIVDEVGEYCMDANSSTATWDEYVEQLERYCASIDISKEKVMRAVLLGCCGKVTNQLIERLVQPDKPTTVPYEAIKRVVREHLGGKPSPLRTRFLFFRRNQEPSESVTDYATDLRKLAEDCGFGSEEVAVDVMLRDRFVFGIRDDALRERLLDKRDLTFDAAYEMALKTEAPCEKQFKTVGVE